VAKRGYVLVAGGALIVLLVVLVLTSGGSHSNGDYAPFAECPLNNRATGVCIFAQTESGKLIIGRKTIPITKTITLQGGVHQGEKTGKQKFIGALKDETLSVAPQAIPGGLRAVIAPGLLPGSLRERFDELIARGAGQVTATIALAAPASAIGVSTQNLIEAKGVGLSLPVKLRLSNPLLGENCYIGSNAKPIVIDLSTGTTRFSPSHKQLTAQPLTGKPGHAKFKDQYNLVTLIDESLVSDSFAAPRAEGCGEVGEADGAHSAQPDSQLDRAIDARLGLPIARGNSEALLNVTLRDANASAVKSSRRP
jgi:hypothetical protein